MIRGITFVGIPAKDQDVALKFYTECMGFTIATDRPFTPSQRWIELLIPGADTGLALYTPEGHESRIGQFQSIAFWCDDVFATSAILKGKGVLFAQEPKKEPWGSTALIMDADRNQFALSSRGQEWLVICAQLKIRNQGGYLSELGSQGLTKTMAGLRELLAKIPETSIQFGKPSIVTRNCTRLATVL